MVSDCCKCSVVAGWCTYVTWCEKVTLTGKLYGLQGERAFDAFTRPGGVGPHWLELGSRMKMEREPRTELVSSLAARCPRLIPSFFLSHHHHHTLPRRHRLDTLDASQHEQARRLCW